MALALEFVDFGIALPRAGGGEVLFAGATFTLQPGGFYLLVGSSGGGKSSLLRVLAGLVDGRQVPPRRSGRLAVGGCEWSAAVQQELHAKTVAILQDEGLLDELSPRGNVELALRAAGRSVKLAPGLLAQAGIAAPPALVAQLSGGQRKRVAVARALALEPQLLLADEPTAGLDPAAARGIAELLHTAHRQDPGRITLVITHDLAAFEGLVDGRLVLDGQAHTLHLLPADQAPPSPGPAQPKAVADELPALHGLRHSLLEVAAVAETLWLAVRRLVPFEPGLWLRSVLRLSLEPLAFVAGCCAVIGWLGTYFALRNNPIQGGFEAALLTGTGKVAVAVLVPLLAGFFFVARTVAGAAARLGTMQRTNQIAALRMLGIEPADRLLTPLVHGMVVGLPVVTLAGVGAAAAASWLAATTGAGFTTAGWAHSFCAALRGADLVAVLGKAAGSGALVALACYHLGTGPKRSSAAVGAAADAAVVVGMVLVLLVHAVWTMALY
ncbi:MAG: ABC transporter permease [Planctomycetes bacterium]|nr:ABC transporter permease [Planctomycetota bacterium]